MEKSAVEVNVLRGRMVAQASGRSVLRVIAVLAGILAVSLLIGRHDAAMAESVWDRRAPSSGPQAPVDPAASTDQTVAGSSAVRSPGSPAGGDVQVSTLLEGRYDANEDGWLDAAERLRYLQDRAEIIGTEGRVYVHTLMERVYDADGNGVLEGDEAQRLLSDVSLPQSDAQAGH